MLISILIKATTLQKATFANVAFCNVATFVNKIKQIYKPESQALKKILIADDHEIVRYGLKGIVSEIPDLEIEEAFNRQ